MRFFAVLLLSASASAQIPLGGITGANVACNPPTTADRWSLDASATDCSGACSNGLPIVIIGNNNAGQNVTQSNAGFRATYVASAINGHPAGSFSHASSNFYFLTASISVSTAFTFYAVIKPVGIASVATGIVGDGPNNTVDWGFIMNAGGTADAQFLNAHGITAVGSTGYIYTDNVWQTFYVQYNTSTGAWVFGHCSGGTCSSDASGTTASTMTTFGNIGGSNGVGDWFNGQLAEVGYITSASTSGIGAWSQCRYGI